MGNIKYLEKKVFTGFLFIYMPYLIFTQPTSFQATMDTIGINLLDAVVNEEDEIAMLFRTHWDAASDIALFAIAFDSFSGNNIGYKIGLPDSISNSIPLYDAECFESKIIFCYHFLVFPASGPATENATILVHLDLETGMLWSKKTLDGGNLVQTFLMGNAIEES